MRHSRDNAQLSVLLPDGESVFALAVLRCLAQHSGIRTHVLSDHRWALTRFSKHTAQFHYYSDEQRLSAICDAAEKTKADIIVPVDEPTRRLLAAHRDKGLSSLHTTPLPTVEYFDIAANKGLLAEFLPHHQLPCPPTIFHRADSDQEEFTQRLSAIRFPALVKPTLEKSGCGIRWFDDPSQVRQFLNEIDESQEFIVQSYLDGYDIDCSVLCLDGKILTHTIQKGFIPGHQRFGPAAGVEFLHDGQVFDLVARLMKALKWSGIAHVDMRYDQRDQQVKVIEINPRYWHTVLGSLAVGINFPYLACIAALKGKLPENEFQEKRYVDLKTALSSFACRSLLRKSATHFDLSALNFVIKDPLPLLMQSCNLIYSKATRRLRSNRAALAPMRRSVCA